jgi:hypothetical protein
MLLSFAHPVHNGVRVRLRFPHTDDHRRVADLHARLGLPLDEMGTRRLLRFDLRRERVVCALAWIDGAELLVGIAATGPPGDPAGEILVADEAVAPGVGALLRRALAEQVRRRVA